MAFQFPWTNFHELNLDWFLSKFKQFANNFLETTATAESVPYGTQPSVTVTGGELDDDTDIVDPFTFNFKIPAGQPGAQGAQGVQGVPGQDGFSPVATVTKSGNTATISITDANGTTTATVVDGGVTQEQLNTKAPAIITSASGGIANFKDGADNMSMINIVADIDPVQDLSNGDPSPTNICPITGWTGATVSRAGKNLLKLSDDIQTDVYRATYTYTNSGIIVTATGTYARVVFDYMELEIGKQYTLSFIGSSTGDFHRLYVLNADTGFALGIGKILDATPTAYTITFTAVSKRLLIVPYVTTGSATGVMTLTDVQLEIAPSASTYETYAPPTTLNVSWQNDAGTVYGGTIDLSTGVLTVTMANIASYNGETLPGMWISDRDVYAPGTTPTTGAQVVYELSTPQTYQLTPQQLFNTLYGVNNVWSDTGDSTVTYPADTKLFIEQLTQPSEDDMTANSTIASGKFFMIGNNLYRATTAIASGSQIIPGTNATPMSLADALNLL